MRGIVKTVLASARVVCFYALAAGCSFGWQMSVGEVLTRVSDAYRNMHDYWLVAERIHTVSPAHNYDQSETITLGVANPGKVRLEVKEHSDFNSGQVILVSDGETTWTYLPQKKQYTQESVAASGEDDESESGDEPKQDVLTRNQNLLVVRYRGLAKYAQVATFSREDRVKVGGKKIDCYVVELAVGKTALRLWVDKERFLVLRHQELSKSIQDGIQFNIANVINLREAEIGSPPEADLFTFEPPKNATKVEALGLPSEHVSLTGKPAIDFTLKALDGGKVTLSDLRGKVVVLDFWATWCGPCRKELPILDKLSQQYQDKGVVVLGVNDEDNATVKSFLKKNNYNFTVLMDSKEEAHRGYGIHGIPTVVVINREGVVSAHYVGGRSEQELADALKAGGV